jgi:hypothetical protein
MDRRGVQSTDGEVANALVCKTSIHGFKSHSVLQQTLCWRDVCLPQALIRADLIDPESRCR